MACDLLRERKRRAKKEQDEVFREHVFGAYQDMNTNIEDQNQNNWVRQAVEDGIGRLKDDHLKMTLDMHLKGVTDVEIARRQDVTPNVVSGRIRLGKVKLMKDSELKKVWDELKQRGRR